MPHPYGSRLVRLSTLAAVLTVLSACSSGGRAFRPAEGPFLAPGALPAGRPASGPRATPALPGALGRPAAVAPASRGDGTPGLPPGLVARRGTVPLPGASAPGIGPVHALVVPVSLGPRAPRRDDAALSRDVFGAGTGGSGPTLGQQISAVSGGLFRPSFTVLPTLVDSRTRTLAASPSPRQLMDFVRAVLVSAAGRTDLSKFDNDGPDGIPGSRDDDGRLDFVMMVVETESSFPSVTLRDDFALATPAGPVRSGPIHVLSLSRSETLDTGPALGLWLDGLGLDPGERFFPTSFPRAVSSLARARLGWVPVEPVVDAGARAVQDGRALLFPLLDVAAGGGFWLVERDGDRAFVSRVARKSDGHFFATEAHVLRPGDGQVLPLTRQFGERGARVEVRWRDVSAGPVAEIAGADAASGDAVPLPRAGSAGQEQ